MQSKTQWAYTIVRRGQSFGPYSASQLRQLASAKQLMLDDLVCRAGTKMRTRVRKMSSLACLINENQETTTRGLSPQESERFKSVSAILAVLKAYRQWNVSRRALVKSHLQEKDSNDMMACLATEIASRDEFTRSICHLFPVRANGLQSA